MPKTKINHSVLLLCLIRTDGCWPFSWHPRTVPEVTGFSLLPQHSHLLGPQGTSLSYTVTKRVKTVFVVPSNGVQEVLPMWMLLGKLLSSHVNVVQCATKLETWLCHGCRGQQASSQPTFLHVLLGYSQRAWASETFCFLGTLFFPGFSSVS